ncbi:MAG: hypothetical protein AB7I18_08965 [Candidatus Berkiella sp.]
MNHLGPEQQDDPMDVDQESVAVTLPAISGLPPQTFPVFVPSYQ